jgi:ketosteroid isomerase-like protein
MSRENVDLYHRVVDAYNRRDLDAVVALMDENVEAVPRLASIEGGYHGHDGIRRYWENLFEALPDISFEIIAVRDLGHLTLAVLRLHGHGADSDTPFEERMWQPAEWRNGRCVWWKTCRTEADALEAVGLRE